VGFLAYLTFQRGHFIFEWEHLQLMLIDFDLKINGWVGVGPCDLLSEILW